MEEAIHSPSHSFNLRIASRTIVKMLKVVGASWFKTRISTYIIAGAAILSLCALFIAENTEKPEYDGTYCATTYWSRKNGFRVEFWGQQNDLLQIKKGAARICYKDSTFQNG